MLNIHGNLKKGGIYVFDIFNLNYLKHTDNITKLTLDRLAILKERTVREVQFSYVTYEGILASYSTYFEQTHHRQPVKISKDTNTLQCYTADELRGMLSENGFTILEQTDINGEKLSSFDTERILTTAKKI